MATISNATTFVTIADVTASVSGIALSRIRLVPTPGTATERDVLDVQHREGVLCELIDGVLVEKTMGSYESMVASLILFALQQYLTVNKLGVVLGESGMLRLAAGQVRIPDVSFLSAAQFPDGNFPDEPVWGLFPDLAIEVLSRGNTSLEMNRKIDEYFTAGTRLVWIIDPIARTATIYSSPTNSTNIGLGDVLTAPDILPGFSLPLADVLPTKLP